MLAELLSAAQSVKVLSDLVQGSLELQRSSELNLAVARVSAALVTAQSEALRLQAENFSLQQRARELEQQAVRAEHFDRERENYALQALSPGVFAYVFQPPVEPGVQQAQPVHWLCCRCFDERAKSILQLATESNYGNDYRCPRCSTSLFVRLPRHA